ncbi:MAG: class I SAM-dependent methyltransferase [Candidatus Nanohaloarchaea archaeon]
MYGGSIVSSPRSTQAMADYLVENNPGGAWISPAGYRPARRELVDMVDEYAGTIARIADVGCGDGQLTAALAEEYDAQVLALDVSPASCRETRERTQAYGNGEDTHVLCADMNRQPWDGIQFDVVLAANSVQDTEDPAETVDNLYGMVRDGGELIVTVPGEGAMDHLPDHWFEQTKVYTEGEEFGMYYMDPEVDRDRFPAGKKADVEEWGQYIFPAGEARRLFRAAGFQDVQRSELTADARGITTVASMIGDRKMWGESLALRAAQRVNLDIGPKTDVYRLRK